MSARYAIYVAPAPDSPLWRFGSRVLGYDAASGQDLPGFTIAGYSPQGWSAVTARPRAYGFHATLKAPFRLAQGSSVSALRQALADFAAAREAFDLGPLRVSSIAQGGQGFVAMTPQRASSALAALERDAVGFFDRFRAPLTPEDIERRNPARLSERQHENLLRWGYPHVGDDYRFHMTLTGDMDNPRDAADALAFLHAREVGSAHLIIDALALFEQRAPSERFRILERLALRPGPALRLADRPDNVDRDQGAPARAETAASRTLRT